MSFSFRPIPTILLILCVPLLSCTPATPKDGSSLMYRIENSPHQYMDPEIERTSRSLHHYLIGQLNIGEQQYDEALEHLAIAGELSIDTSAHLHRKLAELYVRDEKLEKALHHTEQAYKAAPEDPSILFLHAGTLETLGRDREAESIYLKLLKLTPDNFDVYVLLGSLYSKSKQFDRGIALLKKFVQTHPQNAIAHYYLGHMYELSGDSKKAEKHYLKSHSLESTRIHVLRDLVRLYLKSGNAKKAVEFCKKTLEKSPDNVLARKVLSHLLLGEGKLDEAIEQFQALESVKENAAEARFKIALIHIERHNFKEALTDLHLVLARDPKHASARFYLGTVYASLGQNEKAIKELLEIPRSAEVFVKARTFAAFVLRQEGELDRAEKAIKEAFEVDPSNEKIVSYLMLIYRDRGKYREARDFLSDLLERFPNNDKYQFHYAVILHDLGDKDEGLSIMEAIVERTPDHADALNFIAYSLAEDGRELKRAYELAQRAIAQDPEDPFYMDTLGWIYFQLERYEEAVTQLRKAVAGAGNDVVIIEHYGDALVKIGDEKEARKIYRRALEAASQQAQSKENSDSLLRVKSKLEHLD